MAINPSTNATMTGRVTVADANYPYASSQDETTPGAGDGTPYFKARADDLFGLQQAILKATGIVPSGNADTALTSEYLQGLVEIAMGRATNYDDSGVADAYVLAAQANQQSPRSLFDGQIFEFVVTNTNTGASTVDLAGLGGGVKNIVNTGTGGELTAGERVRLRYRLGSDDTEIISVASSGLILLQTQNITGLPSSVDFTTGIDGTYDHYIFRFSNVQVATDGTVLSMRVSEDGGSTFKSGAADYEYNQVVQKSSTTGISAQTNSQGATGITLTAPLGNVAAEGISGFIEMYAPSQSVNHNFIGNLVYYDNTATAVLIGSRIFCSYNGTTNAIDAIRFFAAAGNLTSGEISLYGVRK